MSMINASAGSDDLCDVNNYAIMKSYIPRICHGVVTARDLISCKEHRVPWDSPDLHVSSEHCHVPVWKMLQGS